MFTVLGTAVATIREYEGTVYRASGSQLPLMHGLTKGNGWVKFTEIRYSELDKDAMLPPLDHYKLVVNNTGNGQRKGCS